MVKKVSAFLHRQNSTTVASAILMITLFLSNILGVVRDHYLTQKIPTDLLSAYYAAFRIPDFIFNILILGAITSAFIPIFTNLISRGDEERKEAWQVAASIINIAVILLVGLSIILAFLMPWLMPFVVPGFDAAHQNLAVKLARIMLLSPIFFGLSYIFGGILNSFKRFLVYALAPIVYNLIIIAGTLIFADKFGVIGVAVSVIIGAFLHFLIQLPVAIKLGFRFQLKIFWQNWAVRRIGLLMIPRAIALGMNQVMLLVFTSIASVLGGYSIAVYNLADNIQTMPMVVFGTSFATAIFPSLSEAIALNKHEEFAGQLQKTTRIILYFMIPMIAVLILLRMQIIRLIFGSGHFGWEQTMATANTLAYFATSLVFTGLIPLFSRAFYALHNTRTPMIVTVIGAVISIVLGKVFSLTLGVEGLALGYSIGMAVSAILLYLMLRQKIKITNEGAVVWFTIKVIIAALLMSAALQESKMLIGVLVDMQRAWGVVIQTLASLTAGLIVYLLTTWIFGCEEIRAVSIIFQRFFKRTGPNDES